ncbi:hypothetical protein BG006_010858 [Podila minutissima]|uniref:NlpC/P60 domain-containing protein n=1 Tax=Podila minutissima TaxID=64525 RepID=A0A9P5VIH1_9FUNG|nr:hypothetical protein BG006_010858 [Podila minutissima]
MSYNSDKAIAAAKSQFGVKYVWGGGHGPRPRKTSGGYDCSGLVRFAIWKGSDGAVDLGHGGNTDSQYRDGHSRKIGAGERQPGDLVFYGRLSDVHHVALYIGNNRMIEAQQIGVPVKESALRTKQARYVRIV